MKKFLIALIILLPLTASASWYNPFSWGPTLGATVLSVPQGGTGAQSFPSGECLKGNGTGAITTGSCGGGGGGDFPFTVNTGYNSTSTVIGFNGLFSTASSTFSSSFFLPSLSQGVTYIGSGGLLNSAASSSIFGFTPITNQLTKGYFIVGGDSGVAQATSSIFISSTGKVGIASTTPYAKFAITNTSADPSFIVEDSASPDSSPFIIDATGNVGIGTTSPQATLDVNGTLNIGASLASFTGTYGFVVNDANGGIILNRNSTNNPFIRMTNNTAGSGFQLRGFNAAGGYITDNTGATEWLRFQSTGLAIGTTTIASRLTVQGSGNTSATSAFSAYNSDATGLMTILNNGNVGVGTTSPWQQFSVNGAALVASVNGANLYLDASQGGGRLWRWIAGVSGYGINTGFGLFDQTAGAYRFAVNPNGNVGIGTTSPSQLLTVGNNNQFTVSSAGSVVASTLAWGSAGYLTYGGGIGAADIIGLGGQALSLGSNGVYDRMVISTDGNVGIGTTDPGAALDVQTAQGNTVANFGTASGARINIVQSATNAMDALLFTGIAGNTGSYRLRASSAGLDIQDIGNSSASRLFIDSTTGNVGIGTTTPNFKLVSTNSTGPQLSLSAGAGLNQWVMRNEGGELAFATSTYTATSSVSALRIDSNGWGIWQMLKSIAKLIIPFGANPTVNTQGEIAIDTTAASSSLAFYDGTAERRLYTDNTKSFFISTSTLSSFNGTGTTTIEMKMVYRPTTIVAVSCKATTTGTAYLDFGDGTNWSNLVTCNTTGTYTNLSSNNTFVMGEMMKFRLGTIATLTQGFTISYVERQDAD